MFRWSEAESALDGDFSAGSLSNISLSASDMIEDLHGSKEYRANLVKVLTGRAVSAAS